MIVKVFNKIFFGIKQLFEPYYADNEKHLRAIFLTENRQILSGFSFSDLIKNRLIP